MTKEQNVLLNIFAFDSENILFITPYGMILGKPYLDDLNKKECSGYIIISDVIILKGNVTTVFNGLSFTLFLDQVIAMSAIPDREDFLNAF